MLYLYPFPSNMTMGTLTCRPHVSGQVGIARISFTPSSSNLAMYCKVTEPADKDSSRTAYIHSRLYLPSILKLLKTGRRYHTLYATPHLTCHVVRLPNLRDLTDQAHTLEPSGDGPIKLVSSTWKSLVVAVPQLLAICTFFLVADGGLCAV